MAADALRKPYLRPYDTPSRGTRPVSGPVPPPAFGDQRDAPPTEIAPAQAAESATATAQTLHLLRHIQQVSEQAITVIDQALDRAS
ncbi:hypothetical protein ABZ297_21005 [Nonomuraea sp. NPDC005983]|uniref:hypothetical protein n=1 Tax=Nonomuraea sp. NPDC005983 TaxID=3155595 RepID=UPI0033B6C37E